MNGVRVLPKLIIPIAPSMIHYAVWTWYDRLLGSNDTGHLPYGGIPKVRQVDPSATIRSLLDHGVDLHARTTSGHTILDGLLPNLVQFDGSARPRGVLRSCFSLWVSLVQQLGFDIREYIHREQAIHDGVSHDLGLGLTMELRFTDSSSPWAWPVFQGPEERDRGEFVCHISQCCIWPEWQRKFALPKRPPPRPLESLLSDSTEIVVLHSSVNSDQPLKLPDPEINDNCTRCVDYLIAYISRSLWRARCYAVLGARYRLEFTFYFAALVSLLGFGYFTRLWTAWIFYVFFRAVERLVVF